MMYLSFLRAVRTACSDTSGGLECRGVGTGPRPSRGLGCRGVGTGRYSNQLNYRTRIFWQIFFLV